MAAGTVREEILALLEGLPESNLRALADVLKRMHEGHEIRRWSPAVGSISDEEAEEMQKAIEEEFERVALRSSSPRR